MATIKEVQASMHEPEHRIRFRPQDPAWDFVTESGHVSINELQVWGSADDVWDEYEIAPRRFVLSRPVHRLIDGGGLSSLACRSLGPARSTLREGR